MREMMQEIADIALEHKDPTGVGVSATDMVGLMHDPRIEELYERYDKLMDEYEAIEEAIADVPEPPTQRELYNRASVGTKVVNLGSGSEERIEQLEHNYSHLDVINVDPLINNVSHDAKQSLDRVEGDDHDRPILSFNTLTQISEKELETVLDTDGVHIVPDLDEMVSMGAAEVVENIPGKTHVCRAKKNTWLDRALPKHIEGYKIKTGYLGINTYRGRRIRMKMEGDWVPGGKPYVPDGRASTNVPSLDYTFKNDGICVKVECKGGKTLWTRRDGAIIRGSNDDPELKCVFYAEWCMTKEDEGVSVLLPTRVGYWNGLKPFHCGAGLKQFAKRVVFEITTETGETIHWRSIRRMHQSAKNEFKVGEETYTIPHDGAIFREKEMDYYIKYIWTIDVWDPESVHDALVEDGLIVTNDQGDYHQPSTIAGHGWSEGQIHEFLIVHKGANQVELRYSKPRPDRKDPDSIEKILFRARLAY